jgi:LAO/AO transport system kinase
VRAVRTVGITGAPGTGKSTLVDALVRAIRTAGASVAVLAVDPSSPFSGGAILGDRVRMSAHALDSNVYIRSLASRGAQGGLSAAVPAAMRVLETAGFDWVIVETVGVGQVELDIATAADTTVVVVAPGLGDAVQAHKAGLMEIADLFVVNKGDRPGAAETERDLLAMVHLSAPPAGEATATPMRGVVRCSAIDGTGVDEVLLAISTHGDALRTGTGELLRERRRRRERESARRAALEIFRAHIDTALRSRSDDDRVDGTALVEDVGRLLFGSGRRLER